MAPLRLSSRLPEPLPEQLHASLSEAALHNRNYDPRALADSVRRDIYDALFDEDGKRLSDAAAQKNIDAICFLIQARVAQTTMGLQPGMRNDLWHRRERGCTPEEFKRSPPTLVRTAQEVFTHPADRIAYYGKNGKSIQPSDIIFSPDRMSNHFLARLGFGHKLAPKDSSDLEKLRAKAVLIPQLKLLLDNAEPIALSPGTEQEGTYRLVRITFGPRKGHILIFQEIAGEDRIGITDLYSAYRRIDHIDASYRKELAQLSRIEKELDKLDETLEYDWPRARKERALRPLIITLKGLVQKLRFVRDEDKRELLDAIRVASRMLEQKNPGATRACINASKRTRLITNRAVKIPRIFGYLAEDQKIINKRVADEEAELSKLHDGISEQKQEPRLANPDVPLSVQDAAALCSKLQRMKAALISKIQFQPNISFAEKISAYLEATIHNLNNIDPKRQAAADSFMRAYVVSKLVIFFQFLMQFYEKISLHSDYGVAVQDWQDDLKEEMRHLNERGLGKKIYTPEYNAIWKGVRDLAEKLDGEMEKLKRVRSADSRKKTVEEIKTAINDFNLPARVYEVPVKM